MKRMAALLAGAALMMFATGALATPIIGTSHSRGVYAGIAADTVANYEDSHFKRSITPSTGDSFWSLIYLGKSYSFDPESLRVDFQSNDFPALTGKWLLHARADHTRGNPFYTTEDKSTTFPAESGTAPVPEPGTMILMGAGFLGLAIYAKRRKGQDVSCDA